MSRRSSEAARRKMFLKELSRFEGVPGSVAKSLDWAFKVNTFLFYNPICWLLVVYAVAVWHVELTTIDR